MKILEEKKSKYNGDLRVVRSFGLGTYIQANGLTQSGGIVGTLWRQTLNKIKKYKVGSVLILGLGGGTVAKLVRDIWPDAGIKGVDIDRDMIELGRKYLGLDRLDVDVKVQDASDQIWGKYDLLIVDLYQGDKFPKKFGSDKFLKSLTKNRVVIFNRLYARDKKREADEFGKKLHKYFSEVEYYRPVTNLMLICT